MMLTGQATIPMNVPYKAGTGSVVISFKSGAYLPLYPSDTLLDDVMMLPSFDDNHFILAGHTFAFPNFDDAETLIEKMVTLGILKNNEVVGKALQGKAKAMSERARQRHFVRTTGLTQKYLEQIQRAQRAVRLLQQGKKPIEAAADAGYADQPHLAKSLKRIMRSKPSNVDDIHKL